MDAIQKEEGPCLVCCSIRSATVGAISAGILGAALSFPVSVWKSRRTAFNWRVGGYPRMEAYTTALMIYGGLTLPLVAYQSAYEPLYNKGCDTEMPEWSWNGAVAGLIAGPIAAVGYYTSWVGETGTRSLIRFTKNFSIGVIAGCIVGGLAVQDYWKFTVVDRYWGTKCEPPHVPRKFPPAKR